MRLIIYTLIKENDQFELVSIYDEVVFRTKSLEIAETFLGLSQTVILLLPEIDVQVFLDIEDNCSCDEYGDIWIGPDHILKIQELVKEPLDIILEIVLCHELGHSLLLEAEADSFNEYAAWLVGKALFERARRKEYMALFEGMMQILLDTYSTDKDYQKWLESGKEETKKALSLLESL